MNSASYQAFRRGAYPFLKYNTRGVASLRLQVVGVDYHYQTGARLLGSRCCSVIEFSGFSNNQLVSLPCRRYATKSDTDKSSETPSVDGDHKTKQNRIARAAPINERAAREILKQLSSPPNILTMSRIMATPYLSYLLVTHHNQKNACSASTVDSTIIDATTTAASDTLANIDLCSTPVVALSLFLAMGLTDFLDGFVARKFNYATVLGTYLDPFADKVFISVMSMTLWYTDTLPGVLVGLWVVRDIGMFSTAYWMVRNETLARSSKNDEVEEPVAVMDPTKTPLKVEANFLSKVNTALQIGLIALGIAGEVPSVNISQEFISGLW